MNEINDELNRLKKIGEILVSKVRVPEELQILASFYKNPKIRPIIKAEIKKIPVKYEVEVIFVLSFRTRCEKFKFNFFDIRISKRRPNVVLYFGSKEAEHLSSVGLILSYYQDTWVMSVDGLLFYYSTPVFQDFIKVLIKNVQERIQHKGNLIKEKKK